MSFFRSEGNSCNVKWLRDTLAAYNPVLRSLWFLLKMLLSTCVLFLAHASGIMASATKKFVVPHAPGQDDTPGLTAALANFSSDSIILFKCGVTYNIFTPIKFPVLTNVEVQVEGNLTYPTDISTIQGV